VAPVKNLEKFSKSRILAKSFKVPNGIPSFQKFSKSLGLRRIEPKTHSLYLVFKNFQSPWDLGESSQKLIRYTWYSKIFKVPGT
jgi:hypothetical protein